MNYRISPLSFLSPKPHRCGLDAALPECIFHDLLHHSSQCASYVSPILSRKCNDLSHQSQSWIKNYIKNNETLLYRLAYSSIAALCIEMLLVKTLSFQHIDAPVILIRVITYVATELSWFLFQRLPMSRPDIIALIRGVFECPILSLLTEHALKQYLSGVTASAIFRPLYGFTVYNINQVTLIEYSFHLIEYGIPFAFDKIKLFLTRFFIKKTVIGALA